MMNTPGSGATSADDLFDPSRLDETEKRACLAAILFAAGEIVPGDRLSEYFGADKLGLTLLVEETAGMLRPLGLDILAAAGGYRLVTAAQWDISLRRFHRQVRKAKLSKSALEILAIIAYEQPVTRVRIDELRQVNSESTLRGLLDRRLITVAGRDDTPGRPFLYRTTGYFLEVFGLQALDDLPPRPVSLDLAAEAIAPVEAKPGLEDLPDFSEEESDELS